MPHLATVQGLDTPALVQAPSFQLGPADRPLAVLAFIVSLPFPEGELAQFKHPVLFVSLKQLALRALIMLSLASSSKSELHIFPHSSLDIIALNIWSDSVCRDHTLENVLISAAVLVAVAC